MLGLCQMIPHRLTRLGVDERNAGRMCTHTVTVLPAGKRSTPQLFEEGSPSTAVPPPSSFPAIHQGTTPTHPPFEAESAALDST
eukprot:3936838-Rhodomonas_salina.1